MEIDDMFFLSVSWVCEGVEEGESWGADRYLKRCYRQSTQP